MCLVNNAFEIEVINNFKKYILILIVFNLNIVDLTFVIIS
jgi:hypothetical protein